MPNIAIIVPCYNEAKRLQQQEFISFLKSQPEVTMVFVDDGSDDYTATVLKSIVSYTPQAIVVSLEENSGKGEAVRQGLIYALSQQKFDYIGYLDADLSTTLPTYYKLYQFAQNEGFDIVLGSRIKKVDTVIDRTLFRHYIGRIIATVIDKKLKLGIYDTQCGAKVFRSHILKNHIEQPFYTKWFFDIELLVRVLRTNPHTRVFEMPLPFWRSVKNSKINALSFPAVLKELLQILRHY